MSNFTYVVADETSHEAAVIDPSWDLDKVLKTIIDNGLNLKYIINTHTHFDHVLGNEKIASKTKAKIVQHSFSNQPHDLSVDDGQELTLGLSRLHILYTPGHSNDSICVIVDEESIFTGDTLFVGNCGRVDLPGGNASAMFDSLHNKLANLNDSLIVYPGHNYGETVTSTLGEEKRTNSTLKPRSRDDFMRFMSIDE
jgi:glyoxylase-like metal-dependent hydrolase (beta-lactamase superfamily II)